MRDGTGECRCRYIRDTRTASDVVVRVAAIIGSGAVVRRLLAAVAIKVTLTLSTCQLSGLQNR